MTPGIAPKSGSRCRDGSYLVYNNRRLTIRIGDWKMVGIRGRPLRHKRRFPIHLSVAITSKSWTSSIPIASKRPMTASLPGGNWRRRASLCIVPLFKPPAITWNPSDGFGFRVSFEGFGGGFDCSWESCWESWVCWHLLPESNCWRCC